MIGTFGVRRDLRLSRTLCSLAVGRWRCPGRLMVMPAAPRALRQSCQAAIQNVGPGRVHVGLDGEPHGPVAKAVHLTVSLEQMLATGCVDCLGEVLLRQPGDRD